MATATLIPTANASFSGGGTITYHGGSADYTTLFDASDSTYSKMVGTNCYQSFPITDTPVDCDEVTAVSVSLRMSQNVDAIADDFYSAQFFESDGTTALTSAVLQSGLTGTPTDYLLTGFTIVDGDPSVWDGAVLKLLKNNDDEGGGDRGIRIYEISAEITYGVAALVSQAAFFIVL